MALLHRFLVDYDMAMLRALAQNRGIALSTNHQPEAVDQLAAALLDPLSVRTALAHLSPLARTALDALLASGGRMRTSRFGRRFGSARPLGPGRLQRESPWQKPANPTEELWYAGLIFRGFDQDESGPDEFFFIPDDLFPLLPPPRSSPAPFAVEQVAGPPAEEKDGPALVHDLFIYLVYVQNHDVRPYADGRLGRTDREGLRVRLIDPGERRMTFLRHLADRLGWITKQEGHLRLSATPVKRWLTASPGRQLTVLQETWRDDPHWIDLCHVPSLQCDQKTPWLRRYDPVSVRRALLDRLAQCPADSWWTLASFVAAVKEHDPDFQRPDGDYTGWYIRDIASGTYLSGFETWDRVEGALIADLLTTTLRWLGIVAVSSGPSGPIIQLTEAGKRFLGLALGQDETPPSLPLIIRPDLSLELPTPVNLYVRFQLERFAELESETPCRYRLTGRGVSRALSRDVRLEQVLTFLQQASHAPVPPAVEEQLRLWARRLGQVRLEEAVVLRVRDQELLQELATLPETCPFIQEILSPTTALVRKQDLSHLQKELRALGYLPSSPTHK